MTAISLSTIVLALLGAVPGETTGWGTGSVSFQAYVNTREHQEIYPVGAGEYLVSATIWKVLNDPADALSYVTTVDVCYDTKMGLVENDMIEVSGIYYNGASPLPYCGRVQAVSLYRVSPPEQPPAPEEPPADLQGPTVLTGSAEATETTVTLQALLKNDGGASCQARFVYHRYEDPAWHTDWLYGLSGGTTISQQVAGLIPNTRYYYQVEAQNAAGQNVGREGSFVTLPETVPPIPQPAVWLAAPGQVDTGALTMTADIERDISGPQEYFFDFVASPTGGAGGTDSSWQFSPIYVALGLNANQQYGYRVKARDGHGNETAYSTTCYAYTAIETPTGVTFGTITTGSIQVKSSNVPSGLKRGKSGLELENVTTAEVSPWQQDNSFWTSDQLLPNTPYLFQARARNGDGDLTPFSSPVRVYTLALVPSPTGLADLTVSRLFVQWSANGNPDGTQYLCQNVTKGTSSAWMTGPQWLDTGLSPNTQYAYRIKARNGDGVETAFSAALSGYSAVESPTGVTFGVVTPTSIQVQSQNTPAGLSRASSGLSLENVTTGQDSPWRQDNSFWTSDGLAPNHRYGFCVRARNGDGVQAAVSATASISTSANAPARGTFTGVAGTSIQVQWGTNGNPSGTLYLCENATAGTNSGWTTATTWTDTGLAPNTYYAYHVKARNADGLETAWTDLGTQSTEYRSLTVSATAGGQVTAPAQSMVRCIPGTVVTLVAAALPGYCFVGWTGSAVDAGRVTDPGAAQTTVLVDAQYAVVANFVRTQIFVDRRAVGAKTGATWINAFTSLQDALDAARAGQEIWMAQGVYKPDVGRSVLTGDRTATFALKSGVALKGGYAGLGQPDPNTRDITVYETILSGDLKGDDSPIGQSFDLYSEAHRTDNSLHVVSATNTDGSTLLEGVTITAGNGIDGAGVCLIRSQAVLAQCLFRANRTGQLSGDALDGWGEGAGVSCYRSAPVVRSCVFLSNWAGAQGGGLYSIESNPTLTDCVFQDNTAGLQGGACYVEDGNEVCVGCLFRANGSRDGGALYGGAGSDLRVTNGRFLGNAGRGSGGAVYAAGWALALTNCALSGNLAFGDGGAVLLSGAAGVCTNCTFNRNLAQGSQTGQALSVRTATATLTNCILWDHLGNTQGQILVSGAAQTAMLTVSRCDVLDGANGIVRKGTPTVTWGTGNLNADPRFQNPAGLDAVGGTPDDDLHLRSGSPCLDAGDDRAVPLDVDDLNADGNRLERIPFDLDGHARFQDDPATANTGVADPPPYPSMVDLGAYEFGKP